MAKYSSIRTLARAGAGAYGIYRASRKRKLKAVRRVGKKIRRTGRIRFTRRRRRKQTAGEWDYAKESGIYGRKQRTTLRTVNRRLNAHAETVQFVGRGISAFGGTNGNIFCANRQSALGAAIACPCFILDVTSARNIVNNAITEQLCMQRLILTNELDTALVQWVGFPAYNWITQAAPEAATGFDNFPNEKSLIKWANLRMMLYAPTALPTRWQIELVQFRDERLVPSAPQGAGLGSNGYGGVAGASSPAFVAGFWQYMLKKFMFNQIEPMANTYRRYVRVLKRMTVYMDPKESTDASNTRYREINFFAHLNKLANYRWDQTDRVAISTDDTQIELDPQNRTELHPRSRIFILIRAVSGRIVGASDTATVHPSFDWYLRTKHEVLN